MLYTLSYRQIDNQDERSCQLMVRHTMHCSIMTFTQTCDCNDPITSMLNTYLPTVYWWIATYCKLWFIMAIIFLYCPVVSIFLSFFPRLIPAATDCMSTILLHMTWPVQIQNTALKCAARGSLQIQDAKVAKDRHLGTIAQLCLAISSQLMHVSTIGKKLLSSNISSTSP